jgi:predicted ATPase
LTIPIRDGGGVRDWLWKGGRPNPTAKLDVVVDYPKNSTKLRFTLGFGEVAQRFEIMDERLEREKPDSGHKQPYLFYKFEHGHGVLNIDGHTRKLRSEDIEANQSILSQRKDPDQYPEITYLGNIFSKIRLYREWSFGRFTPPRTPQKTDLPNDFLESDCSNLGLVLSKMQSNFSVKQRLIQELQALYENIVDYYVNLDGGTVQVFFQERIQDRVVSIPATRLSDGTLRYLCLLSILCHPTPPPLVCIEEPELGLHPDVLPKLAQLMVEASERTQLIVTTHSEVLVDAMTDYPEAVLVAEKTDSGTRLTRLSAEKLKPWLEKYRLGQLWTRGDIGGTRW